MKTVFLFLRQGISNRNLLRTDFLKTLKGQPEVRIVILSPIGDEPGFREELVGPNVLVEKWPRTKVGFWERRLKNLKDYIWVSRNLTRAIRVRRLAQLGWWGLVWRDLLGALARRVGVTEQLINDWELRIYRGHPEIERLYDKYQPQLVVFTRLFGTNVHVIKEAKKREVPILCLVESWDNLICKGPLAVVPDRMAVWNEGMKKEADRFHEFPSDRVVVVGVPQFDLYADVTNFIERDLFFANHGLDPGRKLITYAASTEGFIPDEPEIIERIYGAIQGDQLETPVQLLVRMHPITSVGLKAEYLRRFTGRPNLVLQGPGRTSRLHDGWDPSWSDMLLLASTVFHSDVVVNIASTFSIDAAALDKPIVCAGFGSGKKTRSKYFQGIFDQSHYTKLVDTGGIRVVYSLEELLASVRDYLVNPMLDSVGRKRLREELCYRLDGKSGQRAASVVLRELGVGL
ncbi:MAG: hypothetical protein HYY45_10990 [Deltaproteobacteria bacterium]|nr:hypothetical protein [Deltaproteobacteria bacterium]